ncbi:transmembrane protein 243 isoform X1 [Mirounga angustirostris]|uniref:transmembrane protein 243 isoform X1 n=1 Tax=Mirounga angustirostris TaxID=9716 RepID=UPI001E68FD7D|nr:transmembrane protein 243 isoform X1 [Mirounga angustirostris]XP_054361288.1 transmembrane protein 243 isoform X1 [Mirounga angustirostris]
MAQSGGVNISICREETEAQDLWHQWPGQQTSVRRNVGQGCKSGMRKLSRDGPANHFLGRHRDGHLKMKGHGSTVKARLTTGICNQLGSNHQFSCWQLNILIDSSNADQCFCFPSTTSKTFEYIFCCLHLFE